MKRTALTFIAFIACNWAMAQNFISPNGAENAGSQPAINIAVISTKVSNADKQMELAEFNEQMGDLSGAITLYKKAAEEYNADKKYNKYGSVLLKISALLLEQENYNEAEQVVLKSALKNYSKIGSRNGQMLSYNMLGRIYFAANKLTQSMWFYTQQGILAQQLNNQSIYLDSVLGIADIKIKKKEFGLASKDLLRAEELAKASNLLQYNQRIRVSKSVLTEKSKGKS
ncbi:tetratricopeptide repeat protein [Pedobacter montanisoli]|uniref:Tetratricopeptide repeat protein n=1 Tax=Pedobacter montanisoli TaxID=2923277 RepID=A0ABS9ZSZ5_9SPHI|nr:hypothetical protein [Pedobacter montanisoli]MCJ0741707.1 hypothetical protein [Pedobacter montanisoli]